MICCQLMAFVEIVGFRHLFGLRLPHFMQKYSKLYKKKQKRFQKTIVLEIREFRNLLLCLKCVFRNDHNY